MRLSWLCALLLGGVLLFTLPSCSDSSSVGIGVGPDSLRGGEPTTLDVVPALGTTTVPSITGQELVPGSQGQWRFLIGRVDDPIAGTIEASGYFDVLGRTQLPSDLMNADPESVGAELRLFPSGYVHGDTLSTTEVQVRTLAEEAEMQDARADTTFPAQSNVLTSATISPTDSIVTIQLPDSWLRNEMPGTGESRLSVFQDTSGTFQDAFHGFKLTATGGNVVTGFSSTSAAVRLTFLPDSSSADYVGFRSFTHIERTNVPTPPDDRILLQDGVGTRLTMNWDYGENPLDSLKNSPLSRAEIYVPVDTMTLIENEGSPSFVRPLANGFRLHGDRAASAPSCSSLGFAESSSTGAGCLLYLAPGGAPGAALFPHNVAFSVFERSLLQEPVFSQFSLEVATRPSPPANIRGTIQLGLPSTLPVLIPSQAAEDFDPPRATLTVTPL